MLLPIAPQRPRSIKHPYIITPDLSHVITDHENSTGAAAAAAETARHQA
jgi:hypothetical protein